jgi:hypothetical protein
LLGVEGRVRAQATPRALGKLLKQGWRPQRTVIYCFWDGEEPALFGSTEWAETLAAELSAPPTSTRMAMAGDASRPGARTRRRLNLGQKDEQLPSYNAFSRDGDEWVAMSTMGRHSSCS